MPDLGYYSLESAYSPNGLFDGPKSSFLARSPLHNAGENKHLIIGCTVMPKYTKDVGLLPIKDCENTTLSYNPEFIAHCDIRCMRSVCNHHSKMLQRNRTVLHQR